MGWGGMWERLGRLCSEGAGRIGLGWEDEVLGLGLAGFGEGMGVEWQGGQGCNYPQPTTLHPSSHQVIPTTLTSLVNPNPVSPLGTWPNKQSCQCLHML